MNERIQEGDIVHVTQYGVVHEAIADGPVENGEVWVRFTTRGREMPVPAKHVRKVADAW